jgi:15-cis-phytoene synthase
MSAGVQSAPVQSAPTEFQLAVAYSVCRSITRANAKNFYYAFLVLPRRKREALCAVYAFMRRCDDISDDASLPLRDRRLKLADWLDSFHRVMQGRPSDDPVMIALADAQRRFKIPIDLLDQLAFGTAMDLTEQDSEEDEPEFARGQFQVSSDVAGNAASLQATIRYQTFDNLYQYCYKVASVVGLVCIRIFGYRDPMAEPLAERCGLAFQLTNIIRDVKEDAALGRVYLPQEDLDKFGLNASELSASPDPARFRPLLSMEADRAREFYRAGEELLLFISEDSQPALWVLVTIYRQLLEKIAARQYDVFSSRVSLTVWEKVKVLGKGFVKRLA